MGNSEPTWEIVRHLDPRLATLDYKLTSTKVKVILGSFMFFFATYFGSAIIASMTSTYRKLRTKEKVFWNLAVVRAVFGVFGAVMGGWAIFNKTEMDSDVVFGTTKSSYFALCVTEGFFIFECSALAISDVIYKSFSFLLNLHHWLSLVGYFVVIYLDAGHCFATKGLLLEMSTPFSALCWTLLKCGQERSFLWKANQFLLVHTFHCRNIVEWLLIYITYQNWSYVWSSMPLALFLCLYIQLPLVTLVMTPYWTYKKTAQMFNPVDWNFEKKNPSSTDNSDAKGQSNVFTQSGSLSSSTDIVYPQTNVGYMQTDTLRARANVAETSASFTYNETLSTGFHMSNGNIVRESVQLSSDVIVEPNHFKGE